MMMRQSLALALVLFASLLLTDVSHAQTAAPTFDATATAAQALDDIMARQRGEVVLPRGNAPVAPEGGPLFGPQPGPPNSLGPQSQSDYWRGYRGGDPADIVAAVDSGQAMTTTGQQWRLLRENYIRKYAGWFPVGVIAILALFFLLRGRIRIVAGFSGNTIPRFTINQRVAHWFMAAVFSILALSGLIILLGRPVLLPLFGPQANSILTSAALQGHNLFGPIFILALAWLFVKFIRGNFFQIVDLKWILKLGGMLGGHVSSRQFNFGEKAWFWMVILIGILLSVTGVSLEFPWLFGDIRILQASTILHALGAIALISVSLGHIYIGTIGMEGSIDSMLKGEVDENWAKEHHDLWYEEVTGKPASEDAS